MRIGLDLDGVCYNYSATACYLLNHYKGYGLDWTETNSWDWLQEQVKNNDWQWLWSEGVRKGLFRYGSLVKGAAEGVKELSDIGDICVITSRPNSAVTDTLEWLAFMRFPVKEFHIMSKGESKATVKPDIAIDDKIENILDYNNSQIDTILFDQKYNWNYPETIYNRRAYDWNGVVDKVRSYANG